MVICPRCQSENRSTARFCRVCGAVLPQTVSDATADAHIPPNEVTSPTYSDAEFKEDTSSQSQDVLMEPALVTDGSHEINERIDGEASTEVSFSTPQGEVSTVPTEENHLVDSEIVALNESDSAVVDFVAEAKEEDSTEIIDNTQAAVMTILQDDENLLTAPLAPLSIGTVLLGRYAVTELLSSSDGVNIYKAEDHGICRSCGIENLDPGEEKYCFNCGAYRDDPSLPWATVLLNERESEVSASNALNGFTWQDRFYAVMPDETTLNHSGDKDPAIVDFAHGVNLLVAQRSDVGIVRADRPDEDSLFAVTISAIYQSTASPTVGLYIVADGMGGHGHGEVASRMAVETISGVLLQSVVIPILQGQSPSDCNVLAHIDGAIQTANRLIFEENKKSGKDMGTTSTLALVVNDRAYIANVGDSRTYLWAESGLHRITDDHSVVFNLVKAQALEEDEIYDHPRRSEIFRSLGAQPRVEVDHYQIPLMPGNTLLLCCDGLWEMLRTEGIADVLMLGLSDPQVICDDLVRRANAAGGEDNISVIVIKIVA